MNLEKTTTFSGADTTVYIYRDLVELLEFDKSKRQSRSKDSVKSTESIKNKQAIDAQVNGILTDGGVAQKGSQRNLNNNFQRNKPTSVADSAYDQQNKATSSSSGINHKFSSKSLDNLVKELGSLDSITYSSFREKSPVRTLGRTQAKGYTRGQRTIAGTMVFNIFQEHELLEFSNSGVTSVEDKFVMLDQIEPFNLMISFINEYGAVSVMHLFNVDINTESQGMSINQISTSNTMNFFAQDLLPVMNIGNYFSTTDEMLFAALNNETMKAFLEALPNKSSGFKSIESAIGGRSEQDNKIQKLLQRSRGLF